MTQIYNTQRVEEYKIVISYDAYKKLPYMQQISERLGIVAQCLPVYSEQKADYTFTQEGQMKNFESFLRFRKVEYKRYKQ